MVSCQFWGCFLWMLQYKKAQVSDCGPWSRHEKTCLRGLRPGRTKNRSAQPQKLDRGLTFRIRKLKVFYYLVSEQQRCWSDCADAQADLRLCCSHMALTYFFHVVSHLFCPRLWKNKNKIKIMRFIDRLVLLLYPFILSSIRSSRVYVHGIANSIVVQMGHIVGGT